MTTPGLKPFGDSKLDRMAERAKAHPLGGKCRFGPITLDRKTMATLRVCQCGASIPACHVHKFTSWEAEPLRGDDTGTRRFWRRCYVSPCTLRQWVDGPIQEDYV